MRLAITGLGLLSSVGHDVATACASIRAGIQRPQEVPYYSLLDFEEQDSRPLVGRPVTGYSEGFVGAGLWLRLAIGAVEDLMSGNCLPVDPDASFWADTGLCVVTPDLSGTRFELDDAFALSHAQSRLVAPLLDAVAWGIPAGNSQVISVGHTGAIEGIAFAETMLATGRLERVIVLCADSYLDPLSLDWLDAADRLKAEDNPFGIIPGEAAACMVLESVAAARARGVEAMAYINGYRLTAAQGHPLSGEPMTGGALAAAISDTLSGMKTQEFSGLAVADLNGEAWRAQEWGTARSRLGAQLSDGVRWVFPCDSLGETGAASGAVAVCVAVNAFRRGATESDSVLISSMSESGAAACVCVGSTGMR